MRYYHIFISHSWRHSEDCERLIGLLNKEPYFRGNFKDYSVTKNEPLCAVNGNILIGDKLNEALREQIGHASVVLIPAGRGERKEFLSLRMTLTKLLVGTVRLL